MRRGRHPNQRGLKEGAASLKVRRGIRVLPFYHLEQVVKLTTRVVSSC